MVWTGGDPGTQRRSLLAGFAGGAAGMIAGLPQRRGDQTYIPTAFPAAPGSQTGLFRKITIGSTVIVSPSGDRTGATDPAIVQTLLTLGFVVILAAGTFFANATVTGHEFQYVLGQGARGATNWQMTVPGIAAFNWTLANPNVNTQIGGGGLVGVTVLGPSLTPSPNDGSIGLQLGDIVQLECDIVAENCQTGLLLQNGLFQTEQGEFRVVSQGCTNPVVAQVATSGGTHRNGSFDRCRLTVYHNETYGPASGGGAFGLGGVQLLNGANWLGGCIRQYGNFSGTGQVGVYGIYVSGAFGGKNSLLASAELVHNLEYDGTGTPPNPFFIGGGNAIDDCWGSLYYVSGWGTAPVNNGIFRYYGPVTGPPLAAIQQAYTWGSITSGFPAGVTGTVLARIGGNAKDESTVNVKLVVAAGTNIANGATLFTLPSDFTPFATKQSTGLLFNPFGANMAGMVVSIAPGGAVQLQSSALVAPAGGNSEIDGLLKFPVGF